MRQQVVTGWYENAGAAAYCRKMTFMFFNKKTLIRHGVFDGFTDHHTHILPDVDDGVKTMSDALTILDDYEEMGVKEIFLTPHIQEYMPNTTKDLQDVYSKLTIEYKGTLKLHLAAEYMLDNLFAERFAARDLLFLFPEERMLLVETSYFNPPIALYDTLQSLIDEGITPVLAHPERYMYMNMADYRKLKAMKVLFQLNVPALIDMYGIQVRQKANDLLDDGMYDFCGTDIHSRSLVHALHGQKIKKKPLLPGMEK